MKIKSLLLATGICLIISGCGNNNQIQESLSDNNTAVSDNEIVEAVIESDGSFEENGRTFYTYTMSEVDVPVSNTSELSTLQGLTVSFKDSSGVTHNNVTASAVGNNLTISVPFDVTDAMLTKADLTFYLGEDILCQGVYNLTASESITLSVSDNSTFNYVLNYKRETLSLPVIYIYTENGSDIESRYDYLDASVIIDNSCGMKATNGSNVVDAYDGDFIEGEYSNIYDKSFESVCNYEASVRGRGNASWYKFPQKSYMIKFDDITSIFGMTPARKYALISSSGDYGIIRNCVAMDIASGFDGLEYTAAQIPVDVFINGEYAGIYTLSEHAEPAQDKIDLFSEGTYNSTVFSSDNTTAFLLECGSYIHDQYEAGVDYFYANHAPQLFIKYPEITEAYNDDYKEIVDYMRKVDTSFVSGYNYEEYVDIDSWVDWFIVMELTCNTDSALNRSTFMYKRADSKLFIGPVWDFDMAFGNCSYDNPSHEYWATAEPIYEGNLDHYYTYLYKSDAFMNKVRTRWDEVKTEMLDRAMTACDKYGAAIEASRPYHNARWNAHTSEYSINSLRSFIRQRYNWIDSSLHMPDFNRHDATLFIPYNQDWAYGLIIQDLAGTVSGGNAEEGGIIE